MIDDNQFESEQNVENALEPLDKILDQFLSQ